MNRLIDRFKDKKFACTAGLLIILFIVSLFLYGRSRITPFTDEYMEEIFTAEENESLSENNNTVQEESGLISTAYDDKRIIAEIKGEVIKPDVYELSEGSIVKDLIDIAGGLTENADISNINRAKVVQNHELIIIYNKNDDNSMVVFNNTAAESEELININSATLEQLKKISGIGDTKAQSIIDYRESNGGFKSLEEIKNVDGIGEKTFEKIKNKITL